MDSVFVHLGVMLGHLGFKLMVLWPFWLQVGASWSHLDSNLGVLGVILEATRKIDGFLRFPGGQDLRVQPPEMVLGRFLPRGVARNSSKQQVLETARPRDNRPAGPVTSFLTA